MTITVPSTAATATAATVPAALRRRWAALATGLLLGLHGPARAADDDAQRAQIEQKVRLTAKLIADSPTAQRIGSSGNAQAVAHFDEGRLHQANAESLLAQGDLAGARHEVDDALRHIGMARRLAPDLPSKQAAARSRYEQWAASVDRLIASWQARVVGGNVAEGDALTAAIGLLGNARGLADAQRYDEANQALAQTERQVLEGMNRLLRDVTLDYTERPAGPAEEFQHELQRERGLAELIPLAVHDLRPRPDAMALIERYAQAAELLRSQALVQFQAGNTEQALADIRNAILNVQHALRAAGVVTTPSTGAPP